MDVLLSGPTGIRRSGRATVWRGSFARLISELLSFRVPQRATRAPTLCFQLYRPFYDCLALGILRTLVNKLRYSIPC